MLLSIDRVLQLLSEGKSIGKIAEFARCSESDVISVINEARTIISGLDKKLSRKKIIIRKNSESPSPAGEGSERSSLEKQIFRGSELSAVPVESSLIMYTDGTSPENPGPAGIGILIHDREDRQVGKVSAFIGKKSDMEAKYHAVLRALEIALYFRTVELKIRTDSELLINQINGTQKIEKAGIRKIFDAIVNLRNEIKNCRFESVTANMNEKADYLSRLAAGKKSFP